MRETKPSPTRQRVLAPQLSLQLTMRKKPPPIESELAAFKRSLASCWPILLLLLAAFLMSSCATSPPPRLDCPEGYMVEPPERLPVPKDGKVGSVVLTIDQTHDIYFELRRQHVGLIGCVRVYQSESKS